MRRVAPILALLALAACAGGPASTPTPAVAPGTAPSQPTARAVPPPAHAVPRRGYQQEVDELLGSLAAGNRPSGTPMGPDVPPDAALPSAQAPTPHPSAGATGEAFEASYEENLQTCLDGRFPAFCDHSKLSAYDAARVDTAEREAANFVTCIDPQWQHLCRPELLPGSDTDPANSPDAGPP